MFLRDLQQYQRHALICVLYKRKMRTVMRPHSKMGLKKFFPNVPDVAKKGERGMERVEWVNALREPSLRFAKPASRTSSETVGSSDKRVATTRPAVCVRA